jgi:hypothetical protein
MILGDRALADTSDPAGQNSVTLDDIFRRVARRRPDTLALADAPNRATFTDGAQRKLTFAEADRMITAIAGRLHQMGLPADAIVGIQLPNVVENILAILGVMRAGMIAAPLPLLWRRADAVAALARSGAKALITCGQVGGQVGGHVGAFSHSHFAMGVAAEVFSIRYVCGFGTDLPDGVVAFDDLFGSEELDPPPPLDRERQSNPASHIAAITFDVGDGGVVPVARNHLELLSGGLGVLLESGLAQDAVIVSTLAPASFAGLCLTLLPWLLSGGTLLLHHPFDADILAAQLREHERCGALILPGPVALRLAETDAFTPEHPGCVIATWRSPERLAASEAWGEMHTNLVDVSLFGEAGLIAARRSADGRPEPLPLGPVMAPRGGAGAVKVAELVPTPLSTVGLRGPMVPQYAFPPGAERAGLPHFAIGPDGLVDTGYSCEVDVVSQTVAVTAPPSGIVNAGGYRFPLRDLQDAVGRADTGATLTAIPDPLVGQRMVGNAADRATVQAALNAVGVNPIVVAAFRDRDDPAAAPLLR